ncbi:pyruvate synthase subunit beta [Desulfohalobiaceae bacterium Ax17]|uniref:pyruvate synthase subunit PorB n=1 Tax=Desulfovulcanus ferrireducens TaxID=2831190 RepID=UPI00207BB642|nr:pyruvate synthase subunit PorB [Desulfovulcanus ferrireducens]MBT8763206.1 pyruvate synthase subunit beta [Desulfovulcanus ferrireducens]
MLNKEDIKFEKITAKNLPKETLISPGHRACQGCGEILAMGMVMKAAGPNTIVANATGCMEIVTSPYPETAWRVPWLHVAFENAGAVASGIEAAVQVLHRKNKLKEKPNIIAFAGDGATADIGLQSLSGALERGHDFLYVCLDNEAYMNTGIQRSSSTPYGAMTTTSPPGIKSKGQYTWKKNVAMIAAAHNIPYVATASPAYYLDLMNKVRKALAVDGPAYIQIYSPCPTGWRSKPEQSITLAKLAVQTGAFPLYEVENGRFKITQKTKELKPIKEYLQLQRRFRHLADDDIAYIQERVQDEFERLKALAGLDA